MPVASDSGLFRADAALGSLRALRQLRARRHRRAARTGAQAEAREQAEPASWRRREAATFRRGSRARHPWRARRGRVSRRLAAPLPERIRAATAPSANCHFLTDWPPPVAALE